MMYQFTETVKACAACGKDHDEVAFYGDGNSYADFPYRARCPETNKPIKGKYITEVDHGAVS